MRAFILLGIATLVAATALPAQGARNRDAVGSRIDTTLTISSGGTIDLSILDGDIIVTGWDRREVRIVAETERGELRLEHGANRISLRPERNRSLGADSEFRVSVPAGVRVQLNATSGDLVARGVRGDVDAASMSGEITIEEVTGAVSVETLSGEVAISRATGDIQVQAVSGDITVDRASGRIEVESVSGEIQLGGITSKSVRAATVSGEVDFDGTLAPDGRYDLRSHSGDVRVVLPAGVNATVGVSTFSGEIDSDFELVLQPGERRSQHRQFQFRLGAGGARIDLESFSGDIYLDRGTSGRDRQGGAR